MRDLLTHYLDRTPPAEPDPFGKDPCQANPTHHLVTDPFWRERLPGRGRSGSELPRTATSADERDESALPDRDQKHPELTPDQDEEQRGDTGKESVGHTTSPKQTKADSEYQPDPHLGDDWRGWIAEIGREHRPRREDVYPYLLVRAMSPGDRGRRPLWPPIPCWESPDILLVDASWTGAFSASGSSRRRPRAGPTGSSCGCGTSGCCPRWRYMCARGS